MGKAWMKNRQMELRGRRYDNEVKEIRETADRLSGERIRLVGEVHIDRSVFKKSKKEKELLKLAKLQCKLDVMRK